MKLVESPIKSNINLETTFPNFTKFILDRTTIKYYKIYTLGHIQLLYVDTYDKVQLFMVDDRRKITDAEIDFVIEQLLQVDRSQLKIDTTLKDRMLEAGVTFRKPVSDIVLITKEGTGQ